MNDYKNSATLASTVSVDTRVLKKGGWNIGAFLPSEIVPVRERLVELNQVHGGNIADTGALSDGSVDADGVLIKDTSTAALIRTADCAPVAVTTEATALLLHISRKTVIHGLFDNLLTYVEPTDITHVHVGPHICEYHFRFDEEGPDLRRLRYRYPEAVHFHKGMIHVSLRKIIDHTRKEMGIHEERVTYDGRCTYEHEDLPSYRRMFDQGQPKSSLEYLRTVVWK